MIELLCWDHSHFLWAKWDSIGITLKSRMGMLIERNSGDPSLESTGVIDVPSIKSSVCSYIYGKLIECIHRLLIERPIIRYISFIEGLGVFGQHHISIVSSNSGNDAAAVSPEV